MALAPWWLLRGGGANLTLELQPLDLQNSERSHAQSHSKSTMSDQIRTLVEEFTSKLELMIRRTALEQVAAALGDAVQPRRGPGRPRGPAQSSMSRPKKGGKRSPEHLEEMAAKLLAHVRANPGQRGEQIAAALKTDVGTMRLPMQKLMAAKKIKTKGQRRGTSYMLA